MKENRKTRKKIDELKMHDVNVYVHVFPFAMHVIYHNTTILTIKTTITC